MDDVTYGINVALTRHFVSTGVIEEGFGKPYIPDWVKELNLRVSEGPRIEDQFIAAPIRTLCRAVYRATGKPWAEDRMQEYLNEYAAENYILPAQPKLTFNDYARKTDEWARRIVHRKDFYQSKAWKDVRYRALEKHGARCQCCGATEKDGIKLHVDHIKPKSKHPSLAFDINNLQILCGPCNQGKGAAHETDWRM